MNNIRRTITIAIVAGAAALLVDQRTATAQPITDLCAEVGCSRGPLMCAEISGRGPSSECEEGVMCCPFPDEDFYLACREGAAT